ncbi:MAG: hypothetical protein K5872_08725 [Rhizobiaceae bacterium]|nr:hypothetical protein [Rhizobiaceae bacterium]MCV0406298.1 hypothetical protein [Rhizobiaceae bacterium]
MIDPDNVYTADEAAELLKLTRRAVITAGKRYGLCFVRGRQVNFLGKHLLELIEAMRFKPTPGIQQRHLSAWESAQSSKRLTAYVAKQRAEKEARKAARQAEAERAREARRQREAQEREERLVEKRRVATEMREAKAAKAAARRSRILDTDSRDPAYWTDQRKLQLREERVARMKKWAADEG